MIKGLKICVWFGVIAVLTRVAFLALVILILMNQSQYAYLFGYELFDTFLTSLFAISFLFFLLAGWFIVKFKGQESKYRLHGFLGLAGLVVLLVIKDNNKEQHDEDRKLLAREKENERRRAQGLPPIEDRKPYSPPPPEPAWEPPAEPEEETIEAEIIQVRTTDGRIINLRTIGNKGDFAPLNMSNDDDDGMSNDDMEDGYGGNDDDDSSEPPRPKREIETKKFKDGYISKGRDIPNVPSQSNID